MRASAPEPADGESGTPDSAAERGSGMRMILGGKKEFTEFFESLDREECLVVAVFSTRFADFREIRVPADVKTAQKKPPEPRSGRAAASRLRQQTGTQASSGIHSAHTVEWEWRGRPAESSTYGKGRR